MHDFLRQSHWRSLCVNVKWDTLSSLIHFIAEIWTNVDVLNRLIIFLVVFLMISLSWLCKTGRNNTQYSLGSSFCLSLVTLTSVERG